MTVWLNRLSFSLDLLELDETRVQKLLGILNKN
jgi:hypothetical protein